MALVVSRFEVWLVRLGSTVGSEIQKTRPCVIVSPDQMNHHVATVIVAPMTTKGRNYPTRIPLTFRRKKGQVVLDQIRTVDRARLVTRLGKLDTQTAEKLLAVLAEMFAP